MCTLSRPEEARSDLDLDLVRERFESSTDFTIGLEEEFAILDPATLELEHRFEDIYAACQEDEVLAESAAGELIASEIEIRSGRSESFAEAIASAAGAASPPVRAGRGDGPGPGRDGHPSLGGLPRSADHRHARTTTGCGANWAGWRSATTPGACTCTWGCAAPTGRSRSATGCASCCRCCWRPRPTHPSSTAATPACTPCAPRSSPAPSRAAASPRRSATGPATRISSRMLERTGSIVESTQLWWSVRPHHSFGTVEVRICDAQTRGDESFALAGLIAACIAQTALDTTSTATKGRGAAGRPRDRGEPLAGDPARPRAAS